MKKLESLPVEELLDQLEVLVDQRDDGKDFLLHSIISIETALLRVIKSDPESDYALSIVKIESDLKEHLVKYGTYLKTEYRKDEISAKSTLKQALRYDQTIPLAHYRLGFIAYKQQAYKSALFHFQHAVEYQRLKPQHKMSLSNQQSYHALLYLSNSALYLAAEAQQQSQKISIHNDVEQTKIDQLTLSPLYKLIDANSSYLAQHAFQITDSEGQRGASWEEYEELIDDATKDALILDMTGREIWVRYGGSAVKLTILNAELLRKLMLNSSETVPLAKTDLSDLFSVQSGDIKIERYVKSISRLREKLRNLKLPLDVIGMVAKPLNGQDTSYYYRSTEILFMLIEYAEGGQ
ncbi:hypothetical protein CSV75_03900 [Sporosarcina sp. P18a]|uniref:hypothetical protein n=1 Tax=Sporosarcina sp. P18a TaxID=2048259 RepID=UPI000C16F85F|nr:hypothetical protein [Sporosarcina sp. P18a]PIC80932.1 hypothetical protein CSV75_03900 [Sporosarcina sp. P18a]